MICNECETVAHCTKHGCVPKQPAPAQDFYESAYQRGYLDGIGRDCPYCKDYKVMYIKVRDELAAKQQLTERQTALYTTPPAQPAPVQETPFQIGQRLRQEGKGISDLWGAVSSDADMPEAQRGFDSAAQPAPVQEPVAIALNTGTKQGVKWLKNVEHGEKLYTTPPAQLPAVPKNRKASLRKLLLSEDGLTAQECEWVNEVNEGDKVKLRGGQSVAVVKSVYRQKGLAPDYYTVILATGDTLDLSGDELADLYSPAAQPAVPDALFRHAPEHPQYVEGWNDCRQAMLEMMK